MRGLLTKIVRHALYSRDTDLGDILVLVDMPQVNIGELRSVRPTAVSCRPEALNADGLPKMYAETVNMGCREEVTSRRESQAGGN